MSFLLYFIFHFNSTNLSCLIGFSFRYEQSETIERELEHMTEQIKSIIQTVNANQVKCFEFSFYIIFFKDIY